MLVASRELERVVRRLPPGASFNVRARGARWSPRPVAVTSDRLLAAVEWLLEQERRLCPPLGQEVGWAVSEPDVERVVVLSDA